MTISRAKFLIFLALVATLIPIALIGFVLLTQFITSFQQGANPASIFNGNQMIIPQPEQAQWQSLDEVQGKIPTSAQQEELLSAVWDAWEIIRRAYQTTDTSDLPTRWAGDAIQFVRQSITQTAPITWSHEGHRLWLTFLSDDGSVAHIYDEFRLTQTDNRQAVTVTARASMILTLDNGFWRVRLITLQYR